MKKLFLCTPHKLGNLNLELINRIKELGFEVLCAVTHTPQDTEFDEMFKKNVELIKQADVFVAVLKDYGKDLTAEVGMAYAWNKPKIGIDFNAKKEDVMCYYAFDKVIKPEQLEEFLVRFK
ncbi:MAG: nucleoside 2-deoxyribosyltransferase [archaeon]